MDRKTFALLENYMCACMEDAAHDRAHIERVLSYALQIAQGEEKVDYDILIAACLLHDIGRKEQFEDPRLCHAAVGGEKAYRFLMEQGFAPEFGERVRRCIQQHRYRVANPPDTVEAKILFDADKLDVTGAIGIARTLVYQGTVEEPLYRKNAQGAVLDGREEAPSFLHEYKFKLEKLYDRFYTAKGKEMAEERRAAAVSFYESLLEEAQNAHNKGRENLNLLLTEADSSAEKEAFL